MVEEPLAFTELRMVFENPNDRQIEGRFEIDMPPGAAISRFAMKIHGRWQEGEVVERQAARVAYEYFLHRKQDPALLENKVDLGLGAHTHGGQVNPVVGVVHVPLARLETDFIDGRYQRGSTTILVTAGVGYSIVPVRYAAPGSIELIELSL